MTKTWETKKKIMEMLSSKGKTLTDISRGLELAPSTVSQHLHELVMLGAIRNVNYSNKWKYYELNREFNIDDYKNKERIKQMIRIPLVLGSLIIIAIVYTIYSYPGASAALGASDTAISISDAPSSYNISSLVLEVQQIRLHDRNGWHVAALQNHTFDLIRLRNISKLASKISLSAGHYDNITIVLSHVALLENGREVQAIIPSNVISVKGNFSISANQSNWINLDFDLQHSIHITEKGDAIFLPVITAKHFVNSNITVNATQIIKVSKEGRVKEAIRVGMDLDGFTSRNFTLAENESLIINDHGGVERSGKSMVPIIIKTKSGITVKIDTGIKGVVDTGNLSINISNGTTKIISVSANIIKNITSITSKVNETTSTIANQIIPAISEVTTVMPSHGKCSLENGAIQCALGT